MSDKPKRNCNSCKHGLLCSCNALKNNKKYQELTDFLEKHEFKAEYVCDDYKSIYIEYPIKVSKINYCNATNNYKDNQVGKFVKIAPCGDEYAGKTFLGIYLGELPIWHNISYNTETKELNVSHRKNPAIFVPDLNKIIYGIESWWRIIEKEEDLEEITNTDINNVWYVKALKALSKE